MGKKTLGRVGIAIPAGGDYVLDDFRHWMHKGIDISPVWVLLRELTLESLKKLGQDVIEAMKQLNGENSVDLAFFSCTSGSLIGGSGYDTWLCKVIKEATGAKEAYTTTTSVLNALHALGSRKITICTPYPDDVNEKEKAYFETEGFKVNNICGIKTSDMRNPSLFGQIPQRDIFDFAVDQMHPDSDTMFISCTALVVLDIIDELEHSLGVPVITSNQCSAWMMGKFFGHHGENASKLGSLFSK